MDRKFHKKTMEEIQFLRVHLQYSKDPRPFIFRS